MNGSKPWWQSRTVWGGILTVLLGAYLGLDEVINVLPDIPEWVMGILGSLFGISVVNGRVRATTRIGGGTLPR